MLDDYTTQEYLDDIDFDKTGGWPTSEEFTDAILPHPELYNGPVVVAEKLINRRLRCRL